MLQCTHPPELVGAFIESASTSALATNPIKQWLKWKASEPRSSRTQLRSSSGEAGLHTKGDKWADDLERWEKHRLLPIYTPLKLRDCVFLHALPTAFQSSDEK
jgi:hypothetical protein